MKKLAVMLGVLLLISALLVGCGGNQGTDDNGNGGQVAPPAEKTIISFSASSPMEGVTKLFMDKFMDLVDERSDGRIEFELFMGGVLGGESEILELIRAGELDMAQNSLPVTTYAPHLEATMVPYLFPDFDTVMEFLTHPRISPEIERIYSEQGNIVFLWRVPYGKRWTTSNKPFSTPDEIRGIKLRLPEVPIWLDVWSHLGALPTPISAAEIFTALQTGVVDAQENLVSNIEGRRLEEVQEYLIKTEHIEITFDIIANEDFWATLSASDQDLLRNSVIDAVEYVKPMVEDENERLAQLVVDRGIKLIIPDQDAIREAAWPASEKAMQDYLDPMVHEVLSEILGR